MNKTTTVLGLTLALMSSAAMAQTGFQQQNLYAGGGVNFNSWSGYDDATGFQLFIGYNLSQMLKVDRISLAAELGYMDTGDFSRRGSPDITADGVWLNAVVGYPLNPRFQFIGRAGIDFGDDDGLMFGIGAGYALTNHLELRGEYVVRDNINSTQINIAYHF